MSNQTSSIDSSQFCLSHFKPFLVGTGFKWQTMPPRLPDPQSKISDITRQKERCIFSDVVHKITFELNQQFIWGTLQKLIFHLLNEHPSDHTYPSNGKPVMLGFMQCQKDILSNAIRLRWCCTTTVSQSFSRKMQLLPAQFARDRIAWRLSIEKNCPLNNFPNFFKSTMLWRNEVHSHFLRWIGCKEFVFELSRIKNS